MNKEKSQTDALLQEFPSANPGQWREETEKLLKGKPFDKVMRRSTAEGITLEPLFWKEVLDELPGSDSMPGFDDYKRGTCPEGYKRSTWEIAQELPYGMPEDFNRAAREDLMRGQSALNILLDIATLKGSDPDGANVGEVGACGLSLAALEDFRTAFREILPEAVGFHFRAGCSGLPIAAIFFAWLREQEVDFKKVRGSFGLDPLATHAAAGAIPASHEALFDEMATLARYCTAQAPGMRAVAVSTIPYHESGASAVDELGLALATGASYLREMLGRDVPIDQAASQIRVSLCSGPDFFMEVAKCRAARVLWSQMVRAFGGNDEARKLCLHTRTGLYNKTRFDPYVNMLRSTTEALSAVIGGVDSLCVGAFDETLRTPDFFSRRIARNTQVILQEECGMDQVIDPAGGSWTIEWLTEQIAKNAWQYFQEIEGEGGIFEALKKGKVAERLNASDGFHTKRLYQRRRSLVGTNVYPDTSERTPEMETPDYRQARDVRADQISRLRVESDEGANRQVLSRLEQVLESEDGETCNALVEAARSGATLGELTRTLRASAEPAEAIHPLHPRRLAEPYEKLRDAAARYADANDGEAPKIFLCNLGPLRRHKPRADFTTSFFAVGGFDVLSPDGFENPDDAVSELMRSGARITVICGSDSDYVEKNLPDYIRAIKAAAPGVRVVLAGDPGENKDTWREAGLDDFITVRSDNYATNYNYLEVLGVI
ncbi:MAG: methylmalonyl-CoA mutase family protein [Opitutales bacterium]